MTYAPLLLSLLLVGQTYCAIDNAGSEFILAFMDNTISTTNFDIEIYITTTSNNIAQVNVTTPLFDSTWISQVSATRGNIVQVDVTGTIRGALVAMENKGVYISASEEVTVYAVNKQKFSTDAFVAFPVDSLGTEYVAMTWTTYPMIVVASVTDGTVVTFTISASYTSSFTYLGSTYSAGSTLSVTLDRFKTFHIYSDSGDLTGTRISASNPISAFSGNKKTKVTDVNTSTSSDHLVEQLPPIETWGNEFVTFPSPDRVVGDYVRVLAGSSSVSYELDGSSYTLGAYEYETHNMPSDSYYWINSTQGITVGIFSKTIGLASTNDGVYGGDPAMSFAVPVAQYGSDYTWSTVTATSGNFEQNYIIVVSYANWTSSLVLDNAAATASWTTVVGRGDYVANVFTVSPGAHSLYNSVPAYSFLGMAYGNAEFNSYAYASGQRLAPVNVPCSNTVAGMVAADGIDNDCDNRIDEEIANGIDDDGDGLIDEDLSAYPRVDGLWGDWGAWGDCSTTCGSGNGTYSRNRTCDNPAPANNGLDCVGSGTETGACTGPATSCPIDGNWSNWGNWSSCSVTCGSGEQPRTRACDTPVPQYGGANCTGNDTLYQACTISDYCLPSLYGNVMLGCGNTSFGCATGSIQCLDIAFRCDGNVDCDDGTDENEYFTGCAETVCKSAAGGMLANPVLAVGTFLLLVLQQRK